MKNLLLLSICLSLLSCGDKQETVTIPAKEYKILKGDTIKPKYPKKVFVPRNNETGATESFVVFLGSDGHEYQMHLQYATGNQWIHYAGCELCKSRFDTILKYVKKR